MTKDLTVGSPMKLIWQFSIPLVLGNLFQQMYNMVDTVIVGRYLGLDALTSVSSTTSITFLIIGFCLGTCTGLAVPVAQKFGAKSYSEMRDERSLPGDFSRRNHDDRDLCAVRFHPDLDEDAESVLSGRV